MLKVRGGFATEAELAAFIEGVEWTNDSALELVNRYELDGKFYVLYEDTDYDDEDEDEVADLQARGRVLD